MSKLSEFRKEYIHTTTIDIGEKGDSITLREPTALEMRKFESPSPKATEDEKQKVGLENVKYMTNLFPTCLVASTFTDEAGKPAKLKDVATMVMDHGTKFDEILTIWMESLPFVKASKENSDSSQE